MNLVNKPEISLSDLNPVDGHFYVEASFKDSGDKNSFVFSAKAIKTLKEKESISEDGKQWTIDFDLIDLGADVSSFPIKKESFFYDKSETKFEDRDDYSSFMAVYYNEDDEELYRIVDGVIQRDNVCPDCGGLMWRHEVDIGVGVEYGPYGCDSCGYSESEQYNVNDGEGGVQEDGSYLDQFGVLYPKDHLLAKAMREA